MKKLFFIQLFLLMRNVLTLARLAKSIAFDGLEENHRGLAFVFDRPLEPVVAFQGVVAAASESPDFVVGLVLYQPQQLRILPEEFFACIGAAAGFEILVL